MNNNHYTPQPAPRALCAAFATLLPLLSLDAMDREEALAVEAHVHTCDYCQHEVADYGTLRDAILREDARDAAEGNALPLLTLAAVRNVAAREAAEPLVFDAPTTRWERPASPAWQRWRAARAFEALVAVLVIALLAALLAWHGGAGPAHTRTPTPTATQDPISQAYITLLRTYYVPLVSTDLDIRNCYITVENTRKLQDMLACRPLWADQLLLVRTLRTQLATASPPARWQPQHAALQQAIDGRIVVLAEQLAAIDAQDVARFLSTTAAQNDNFASFCPIIAQLNVGPPPLSPQLSAPESLMCF